MPLFRTDDNELEEIEARARTYTDERISQIPAPALPTLAQIGAEREGAEARARTYIDGKLNQFPAPVLQSAQVPNPPFENQRWDEMTENQLIQHQWQRKGGNWCSAILQSATVPIGASTGASSINFNIPYLKTILGKPKIFLAYLNASYSCQSPSTSSAYWEIKINLLKAIGGVETISTLITQNQQGGTIENWYVPLNLDVDFSSAYRTLRLDTRQVNGSIIGHFSCLLSLFYYFKI